MASKKPKKRPTERLRTFHYRKAFLHNGAPQELQSLLATALDRRRSAKDLRMPDPIEQEYVTVMYPTYKRGGMLCGLLFDYTHGSAQPTIEIDEEDETFKLNAMPPAIRQQFVSSLLYFGIEGDDMVVMGSRSLQVGHLQNYANWILRESGVLSGGEVLELRPHVPRRTQAMLPKVRYIELTDYVSGASFLRTAEEMPKPTGLFGGISQGLREAYRTEGTFREHLSVSDALEAEELKVSVHIGLPRGRRGLQLLDDLAHVLRHTDDRLVRLKTSRGKELVDGKLRLSKDVYVKLDQNIPDLFEVGRLMEEYLLELRQDNELEEDLDA
jgi:hypothetical protein